MPSKRNTRRSKAAAVVETNEEEYVEEEAQHPTKIEEEADTEMAEPEVKKESPVSTEETAAADNNGDSGDTFPEDNGKESPVKKPWPHRVKEGAVSKVPKDVQKRRRNFRLKKMIVPKAPVMILHEMLGNIQYDVAEPVNQGMGTMPMLYMARTEYDGQEFVGSGPSKSIAKNIAAEQVLQYITAQSCSSTEPDMDTGEVKTHTMMETDTPWSALASLAMFKLFNDWQSQGFILPPGLVKNTNLSCQSEKPAPPQHIDNGVKNVMKPKKEKVVKEKLEKALPENPTERHPVQLLNEMKGPLDYQEAGAKGIPPNQIFTLAVSVDGQTFSGTAKTKKEAKRIAAEAALLTLYDVSYQ